MEDTEKTPDKLTIEIGGKERELFMSYYLLNRLTSNVGDIDRLIGIQADPNLQELLLGLTLSDAPGKKSVDMADVEITITEAARVADWIAAHVMDFFLRGLSASRSLQEKNKEALIDLMRSLGGLDPSTLAMLAAGSSDVDLADSTTESTGETPSETSEPE